MQEVPLSYHNILQSFLLPKSEEEVGNLSTLQLLDRVIAQALLLLLLVHLDVVLAQRVHIGVVTPGIDVIMSW